MPLNSNTYTATFAADTLIMAVHKDPYSASELIQRNLVFNNEQAILKALGVFERKLLRQIYGPFCIAIMTVSFANVAVYVFEFSGKSAANIVCSAGHRTLEALLIVLAIF